MEANRFTKRAPPSCRCTVETKEPFSSAGCADTMLIKLKLSFVNGWLARARTRMH